MTELTSLNVHHWQRRFQLRGGRLKRFVVLTKPGDNSLGEIRLHVLDTTTKTTVRLRLRFEGLEEYRFQRRPGPGMGRLKEVQIGFFGELLYLNLDAFPEDGPPKVMDFRASDCFLAARRVTWEIMT